jgi:hypothetical protein
MRRLLSTATMSDGLNVTLIDVSDYDQRISAYVMGIAYGREKQPRRGVLRSDRLNGRDGKWRG